MVYKVPVFYKNIRFIFLFLAVASAEGWSAGRPCFIVTDLETGRVIEKEGACDERSSPCSTFKIFLSLIGYDAGVLSDMYHPIWPYREEFHASLDVWKVPQDPVSWIKNSCVWYSQELTRKLGQEKFKAYIEKFHYGNRDISGDLWKNNGLTHSWLSSSLKISPTEQVQLLKKLLKEELPISKSAQSITRKILYSQDLKNGWKLYGKTGTGYLLNSDGSRDEDHQIGWFIGWTSRGSQTKIFAYRKFDREKESSPAGPRARETLKDLLESRKLLE